MNARSLKQYSVSYFQSCGIHHRCSNLVQTKCYNSSYLYKCVSKQDILGIQTNGRTDELTDEHNDDVAVSLEIQLHTELCIMNGSLPVNSTFVIGIGLTCTFFKLIQSKKTIKCIYFQEYLLIDCMYPLFTI